MSLFAPSPISIHSSLSGIFFSDLDGTLLRSDNTISPADRNALENLGACGIIRVIATGRSLHSFRLVAGRHFPADYVIFSTGAGIASLENYELLKAAALKKDEIARTLRLLRTTKIDFMLHHAIPENHTFAFERQGGHNPDFDTRLSAHSSWARPLEKAEIWENASQFVSILPPSRDLSIIDEIRSTLTDLSVIRATSPFDHRSTWMEIFPAHISKGTAAAWLGERLKISPANCMAIGNDYNDLELLDHTTHSYVVANAPAELTDRFIPVPSNNDNGVAHAIAAWMRYRQAHD